MKTYDFKSVEARWARKWIDDNLFVASEDPQKEKYYSVGMLPYPSGKLHMGHVLVYALVDAKARVRRMQGFSVLNPIGWDSFGLPAENAAIKNGIHPATWTRQNIKNGREQLEHMGFSFDWTREISSCEPDYYRWTQWLFLFMYKLGLAERREGFVNWCPSCNTVLANEQVEGNGTCWRCSTKVVRKQLTQWYLTITDFAEELWQGLDRLRNWPASALAVQRNWIGRSEGLEIEFALENGTSTLVAYTTRPDTLFGVTFLVLAPEHELVTRLVDQSPNSELARYVNEALNKNELDRLQAHKKTGVNTGLFAIHPSTGQHLPIWVSDYVLALYGTGVVMGVPAHDTRDMEFAQMFNLPVQRVIAPASGDPIPADETYVNDGVMINSGDLDGLTNTQAMNTIRSRLVAAGFGRPVVRYKLRDWLISRQRYWGCPIPIVYCDSCGVVPVPEENLPVVLPEDVEFLGVTGNPLATSESFMNVTCPTCGGPARRETDTMDTFMCSSWYVFRYLDPHNDKEPFAFDPERYWLPMDYYVGLVEHAGCHMIYLRFFVKMLFKHGLLPVDEPVYNFFNNGIVKMDGYKMSKSRGNVVSPDDVVEEFGADSLRFYILSDSPPDQDIEWNPAGIFAVSRYIQSLWATFRSIQPYIRNVDQDMLRNISWTTEEDELRRLLHSTIQKVESDILNDRHNTAISALRILTNSWQDYISQLNLESLAGNEEFLLSELTKNIVLLLAPLMPFLAEEMWTYLGHDTSVHLESWPEVDTDALQTHIVDIVVQINGHKRKILKVPTNASQEEVDALVRANSTLSQTLMRHNIQRIVYVPLRLINYVVS